MKKLLTYLFLLFTISFIFPQKTLAQKCYDLSVDNVQINEISRIMAFFDSDYNGKKVDIFIIDPQGNTECTTHVIDDNWVKIDFIPTIEGEYFVGARIAKTIHIGCWQNPSVTDCSNSFIAVGEGQIPPPPGSTDSTMPATRPQPCPDGSEGIYTAIGCIPTDTADFVNYILARAVSIGGGIAFLLMLFGAFTLITSAGNPENVQKGKDILTSALTGLLFIIFAIFLLKFIGVDILQLPEFEETKITIPSRPKSRRR